MVALKYVNPPDALARTSGSARMTAPRILIAGSSYVADEGRRELTKVWYRLVKQLNPGIDVVLVDSASPFDPRKFLPGLLEIETFLDNVGAVSQGQQDGSGRAFCRCLETAVERGYDYVVPWETDILWVTPIEQTIAKMHRSGVKVAAAFANPYQFPEWACSFWSTKYVTESRFIERYDWQHSPRWPIPEWRIATLTDPDLFILPIHGWRNHENQMNIANITHLFPYHLPQFLTQCRDFQLYYRFLDLHKINLMESA
jgi:hypothetical protein